MKDSPYDYRKKCVGMRPSRIPTYPDIPAIEENVIHIPKAIRKV